MKELPKISVLIPAYNSERTISKCLRSLLKQTYGNIEIIVANDGSTDSTMEIIQEFSELDNRINLYYKNNEKSIAQTRNFLLSKVTTNYFCFVDSDDYVEKTFIETLFNSLEKNNTDMSACSFVMQKTHRYIFRKNSDKSKVFDKNILSEMVLGMNMYFCLWNKLFKTELAKDITFDPELSYGEDFLFCYNYILRCTRVSFTNVKLYHYVQHRESLMKEQIGDKQLKLLSKLFELLDQDTNEENRRCIKAWIAMTSVLFLYKLRHNKVDEMIRLQLNQNVYNYGEYLLKNKYTHLNFKSLFRLAKLFHAKKRYTKSITVV